MQQEIDQKTKELCKAFLKLRSENEIFRFMIDLMSRKEIEMFARRWEAAQMLDKGIPYVEIERLTGLSSATISKVSESLKYGNNGFNTVFMRTK